MNEEIRKVYRPFFKKFECRCDQLVYRPPDSHRKGVYKIIASGHITSKGVFMMSQITLVCISCHYSRKVNLTKIQSKELGTIFNEGR